MRIGGQAVIEGVLMRSTNYTAIATAKNNKIKVKITKNNPFIKKYEKTLFIRGIVYLIDMLVVGIRALSYSTKEFTGEEEKISDWGIFLSILLAFLFSIGLFIIAPFYLAKLFLPNGFLFNLIDGLFRIVIFIIPESPSYDLCHKYPGRPCQEPAWLSDKLHILIKKPFQLFPYLARHFFECHVAVFFKMFYWKTAAYIQDVQKQA